MFFVFHILLLIICLTTQVNNRVLKYSYKNPDLVYVTQGPRKWKIESDLDGVSRNNTRFSTNLPLFQIIKNLTDVQKSNLKSNVFDKMLSDEMLSIKQQFFDKDMKILGITRASVGTAFTPTLEVKQNWLFDKEDEKTVAQIESDSNAVKNHESHPEIDNKHNYGMYKQINKSNEKVLRSLPGATTLYDAPYYVKHPNTACSCCFKTNPTTCSTTKCTHKECTRCVGLQSTAFYITYQPFFLGVTDPPQEYYYQSDILSDTKSTKRKRKTKGKTKKYEFIDNMYYDTEEFKEYRATGKYTTDITYDNFKEPTETSNKIIIDIDYEEAPENESFHNKRKLKQAKHFQTRKNNQDSPVITKTISELLADLKTYYRDSVVKDCYCAMISSGCKYLSSRLFIYIILTTNSIIALENKY